MKTNSTEMIKSIPDFDEFIKLTGEISGLMLRKMSLETKIKAGEANVFKRVSTEEKFFVGGKPPASTYIDNTFKFTGIDNELLPLRDELIAVIAGLEEKKLLMEVYKAMLDVWRTLSSSERVGL